MPDKPVPEIPNLAYWFSEEVIRTLAFLRAWIDEVEEETVRNFLWVAFSETVRECSYTRNGEFKLHRMPAEKLAHFQPDVFGIFRKKLSRNQHGLAIFMEKRQNVEASVSSANTVHGEFPMPRPLGGYDIVVTSPPYGDSHTTVAYGQFSRLASEWIGFPNARKVDRLAMGGHRTESKLADSPVTEAIEEIRSVDEKRANQVAAFYTDLGSSIHFVAKMLSSRATVCYVVGNRSVKGVMLPTDAFVISEFGQHGFSHRKTIVRNIPNKRMPTKNSPSNVAGKTAATMHEENIVVCQRTTP